MRTKRRRDRPFGMRQRLHVVVVFIFVGNSLHAFDAAVVRQRRAIRETFLWRRPVRGERKQRVAGKGYEQQNHGRQDNLFSEMIFHCEPHYSKFVLTPAFLTTPPPQTWTWSRRSIAHKVSVVRLPRGWTRQTLSIHSPSLCLVHRAPLSSFPLS